MRTCIAETSSKNDCGDAVVVGQSYIIGNFLERSRSKSKWHYFKVDSKTSYFYHESIVYTLLHNLWKRKMNFSLKILNIYFQIIHFVEQIWQWHPCFLFDFPHTIFQFTVFVDI